MWPLYRHELSRVKPLPPKFYALNCFCIPPLVALFVFDANPVSAAEGIPFTQVCVNLISGVLGGNVVITLTPSPGSASGKPHDINGRVYSWEMQTLSTVRCCGWWRHVSCNVSYYAFHNFWIQYVLQLMTMETQPLRSYLALAPPHLVQASNPLNSVVPFPSTTIRSWNLQKPSLSLPLERHSRLDRLQHKLPYRIMMVWHCLALSCDYHVTRGKGTL